MYTALLIAFPLVAALLVLWMGKNNAKQLAWGASLVQLALTIFVCFQFQRNAEVQFAVDLPWMDSMGIRFNAGIDGISLLLVVLTNALVPLIIYSSFNKKYDNPSTFYSLVLFMQMALVGVFTALDGFLFYIFWELALIPIYFICLLWGGKDRARITFKFFLYTMIGSLIMLVALIYLYQQTPGNHSFNLQQIYQAGRSLSPETQSILFWGLFIAFAIKMPVFPFHTWQPDTYTNAPTQGTMLLSGIMLKMGIYGAIRWLLPVLPAGVEANAAVVLVLSITGIVYASCIAWVQEDLKRLIAYSSIAHVGLIAAGVFSLNPQGLQGAVFQMLAHGFNVFALFYIADIIYERAGTFNMNEMGGVRSIAPAFATYFLIIMLGAVALPLTNGFPGEFLLLNGIYQSGALYALFAGLTIILGAVYMLGAYQKTMLGSSGSVTIRFQEVSSVEKQILILMCAIVLLMGVFPGPLLDMAAPSIDLLLKSAGYIH